MIQNKFIASSTFRLALLYVTLFAASVLLLFSFIYWSSVRYMAAQSDAGIQTEIQTLSDRYERAGMPGLRRLILDRITRQQPTGSSLYILTDPTGRHVVGNISRWPTVEPEDGWLNFRLETRDRDNPETHPARAKKFQLSGGFRLLVGEDIQELKAAQRQIIIALGWGVVLTLVLGLAGGFFMSRRMLTRLETINQTSQNIIDGDLKSRVPVSARGDEFDRLAINLNQMLDQIQELMESIKQVSDNIAHDLKTPLFRLRQHLESLSKLSEISPEHTQALVQSLSEADRLLGLFNALLRIARIESEAVKKALQPVKLADLARDLAELYEPLAEEKHQALDVVIQQSPTVIGDQDMLFQALANILDNAIKYTPAHGIIQVTVAEDANQAIICICDNGPGIQADDHEKVFQRFVRLDHSRSKPGNGLGLSLARALLHLHDATVELSSNHPGLCVKVEMPINK